jgi:hypothetical protein
MPSATSCKPEDNWLLGFQWGHHWYFDQFLPFGPRTSPYLFDLFSSGLHWILQHHFSWDSLLHYLDDFFNVIAGHLPDAWEQAQRFGSQFDNLCLELGFEVCHKKSKTSTTMDVLGLDIDTIPMEARLPPDNCLNALNLVSSFLKCKPLCQTKLHSILSSLSVAAKVIRLGQPFLRRLYYALSTKCHLVLVTNEMCADLHFWCKFLPQWLGVTIIRPCRESAFTWTDAAGTRGLGGYLLWNRDDPLSEFLHHMPSARAYLDITGASTSTLKKCCRLFELSSSGAPFLEGRHLFLAIDNTAVIGGIAKQWIEGPAMAPLRSLLLLAARWDIELHPYWIPTADNILADSALSHFEWHKIANWAPQLMQTSLSLRNKTSPATHNHLGMLTNLTSVTKQLTTFGGASPPLLAGPMAPPAIAMLSSAASMTSPPSPKHIHL